MSDDKPLTLRTLAEACSGEARASDCDLDIEITHVAIDDRQVRAGSLFVPIRGERFDGHDFIDRAFSNGAAFAVSEKELSSEHPYVLVRDTLDALQQAARLHHDFYHPFTVAVTGSAGKTTTKEMIAAVLARSFSTIRTEGNLNNQTGVPLTLFQIGPDTQAAVVEMGMNHFGEIDRIAKAAHPDVGVITNIGTAHIEYLGSREGILKAKSELLAHVTPEGRVFVNGDDDLLAGLAAKNDRILTFGLGENCDLRAENVMDFGLEGTKCRICGLGEEFEVSIPAPGWYMVYAALAAACCGLRAGIAPRDIAEGIAAYVPAGSRMRIIRKRYTIIDDTYNANAPAMKAALDVLASSAGRKTAVLGEMRELGEASGALHAEVVRYAQELPLAHILLVGQEYENAMRDERTAWYPTQDALFAELESIVHTGDTILVKGSRGMHMEDTVEFLIKGMEESPE